MDEWNFIAERKIREAMEEGAFDQLEGEGRPLDLDENPFEDPSLRMAHRILRNNGFAPEWIEEWKDIERAIHEGKTPVAELNKRIADYNLKAPEFAQKLLLPSPR